MFFDKLYKSDQSSQAMEVDGVDPNAVLLDLDMPIDLDIATIFNRPRIGIPDRKHEEALRRAADTWWKRSPLLDPSEPTGVGGEAQAF